MRPSRLGSSYSARMDSVAMASEGPQLDDFEPRSSSPTMVNKDSTPAKKPNIRKRTKTGCLTCRKRRIKCDEGKPICNNCIKSKRQCEGYNTRVVFKNPMGALPGGPFGPIPYHHPDPTEALVNAQLSSAQAKASSSSQGPLPIIAPKPPSLEYGSAAHLQYLAAYPGLYRANSTASLGLGIHQPQYLMGAMSPQSFYAHPAFGLTESPSHMRQPDIFDFQMPSQTSSRQPDMSFSLPERRHTAYARVEKPDVSPMMSFTPGLCQPRSANHETLEEADDWADDNEDGGSFDSEEEEVPINGTAGWSAEDLTAMVATNMNIPLDSSGTHIRGFHALADAQVLVNYTPSPADTPLNDPKTAAVFWYFVNVTAPALNLFERNRQGPPGMHSGGQPVRKSHQHIWTYVFPVQSLQHPALLRAILALGSLQMAEIQGSTPTASWRHYAVCIRRSARNYQNANRRSQPATLAAILLLGFYEVWSSDHERWCSHMMGARQIIQETPFREMSRQVWAIHQERYLHWQEMQNQDPFAAYMSPSDHPDHELAEIDLGLVESLTGKPVYFVDGPDSSSWESRPRSCTDRDLENYGQLADLYWWFCKMDVYQSILGASKLFMDYDLWTQCPPRAPINKFNQIYGTFDHLILLLGRLSNFVASDLPRKHKARERGANATSPKGPSSPPMFAGMFPGRGSIRLPRGLSPPRGESGDGIDFAAADKILEDMDLETHTRKALDEWNSILAAFELFKNSLGEDFAPLGEDVEPARDSPFGLALTYRTYSIAGVWMNFYMGLVILHRAHPSMPPFAMVAAHMVARQTEPYANEIGKIVAGVAEDWTAETMVSTLVGAAYIECCFPLFVGAVQFRDELQRKWAIRRLHDITRLTGWKTGNQIAKGCEGAWRKAAEMGHAPRYEPESESDALRYGYTTRRIEERIREVHEGQSRSVLQRSDRAHVAFGLVSVEEDLGELTLED